MNQFYFYVHYTLMNNIRLHLLYDFFRIFLFSISLLIQPTNHELNLTYTNREIKSNNRDYTYSTGMHSI
jgi:hypothetical protein